MRKSRPENFMIFRIATLANRINFPRLHRVGSSMVEQRPFKALVEGSSPSQPTPPHRPQTRIKSSSAGFFHVLNCDAPEYTQKHGFPLFIGTLLTDFRGALSEGKSRSKGFQDLSQTFPTLTNSEELPDFSSDARRAFIYAVCEGKSGVEKNERVKGIEPSYAAWEAAVLPLNYTRKRLGDLIARQSGVSKANQHPEMFTATWRTWGARRCSKRKMPCQVPRTIRPSETGMTSLVRVSDMRM